MLILHRLLTLMKKVDPGIGFKYLWENDFSTVYLRAGDVLNTHTAITPPQTQDTTSAVTVGVVADGLFLANTYSYSLNSGTSWTVYGNTQAGASPIALTAGLNGAIAYNPTAKIVASTAYVNVDKFNNYARMQYVSSLGANGSNQVSSQNQQAQQILYSPALNIFILANFGTSAKTFNGTTPSVAIATPTGFSTGNRRWGITSDGYPMAPVGTDLRKYTSTDLSVYTSFGTITSPDYATQTPNTWCPINGRYYTAGYSGSGASVSITRSSGDTDPHQQTLCGSFTHPVGSTNGIANLNFFEDKDGYLYLSYAAHEPVGKGYSWRGGTFRSVDGGVTWTTYSTMRAIARNVTFT